MKIVKKIFSSRNFQNELLQMYIIFLEKSYTKKFNLLSKQINNFIESQLLEFNNYRIKHLIDYNKLNENYDELNKKYNNLNIQYQKLNNNSKILNNKKNKENKDLLLNNINIIRFM